MKYDPERLRAIIDDARLGSLLGRSCNNSAIVAACRIRRRWAQVHLRAFEKRAARAAHILCLPIADGRDFLREADRTLSLLKIGLEPP